MKRTILSVVILMAILLALAALAASEVLDAPAPDGVRPGGTLSESFKAPPLPRQQVDLGRPTRNYPDQPPTIPHSIRGYQVDKQFNQCLSCHSRNATAVSGAPMVSITHFWTREGQALAAVSPRRYFCLQCHVPQAQLKPYKNSTFLSIDEVLGRALEQEREQEREQGNSER